MKFYINDLKELNEEEQKTGKVSYKKIIDRYINNILLCNAIVDIDDTILDNLIIGNMYDEEYEEHKEIYQFFLCDLTDIQIEILKKLNVDILLSFSDKLSLYVLMVDHFGTNWDYIMTNVEWSTNYEDCKLY